MLQGSILDANFKISAKKEILQPYFTPKFRLFLVSKLLKTEKYMKWPWDHARYQQTSW